MGIPASKIMTQQELKQALKVITHFYYDECEIEIVSFTRLKEYTLCRFTFGGGETLALTYDDHFGLVYTPRDWQQPIDLTEPIADVVADIRWIVYDVIIGVGFAVENFNGMPDKNI